MQMIEDYLAAWNATNAEARHDLLLRCAAADVIYLDPHVPEPSQGVDELQALMQRFRSRFDHQLEPEGRIDAHHQVFRLRWRLQRNDGNILSRGLIVGNFSAAGTLARIVHFVDSASTAQ